VTKMHTIQASIVADFEIEADSEDEAIRIVEGFIKAEITLTDIEDQIHGVASVHSAAPSSE
jgi:hypothetical protein